MNARWVKVNFLNFLVADIDIYWLLLFGVFLKKVSSLNVISQVWLTPCLYSENISLNYVSYHGALLIARSDMFNLFNLFTYKKTTYFLTV